MLARRSSWARPNGFNPNAVFTAVNIHALGAMTHPIDDTAVNIRALGAMTYPDKAAGTEREDHRMLL